MDVVKKEIPQKGEPLYEEVEFLLREEFKELRNYFVILEALSLDKYKLSELMNETGLDKGTVSRYIAILDGFGIPKKEIPVTEKIPEKSRKGIYWMKTIFLISGFVLSFAIDLFLKKIKSMKSH